MSSDYSISELAEEFGVTARTLRFYEAQGILNPKREGTRRLFSHRDRVRLRLVVRGKRLGFSLMELKNIIDMYDSEVGEAGQLQYLLKRIHDQCAELERKRQDINDTLRELHMTAARCIEGLAEKYCEVEAEAKMSKETEGGGRIMSTGQSVYSTLRNEVSDV